MRDFVEGANCDAVVGVDDSYGACMSRLAKASCNELFNGNTLTLPSECVAVFQY